jgi:pimeloyl-ACP methyl ester carboxylesterase
MQKAASEEELSHRDEKIPVKSTLDAGINAHLDYSVEEHRVSLDGARMRYLRAGSGPALLLVHGLLGYSFSWRFAIPALARYATVYAVDLIGTGFSDRPPGLDCSFKAHAERLRRFMDAASLSSCHLLGTSHGGAVSIMTAAMVPDRVRCLILVDPVNPWSAHGKRLTVFLSNPLIAPLFTNLAPRLPMLHAFYHHRMFGDQRRIPPDSLEGYLEPMRIPGSYDYGLAVVSSWNRDLQELESALPRINGIRTLLIWGTADKAVDPASAAQLKERLSDCQLVMFEGVGHLPYEEVPDEFNRAVTKFLSESPR